MVFLRTKVALFLWLITRIIFERINNLLCYTNTAVYLQYITQKIRLFEAEKKNLPATHQNPAAFHAVAVFTLNDGKMEDATEELSAEESPAKNVKAHENEMNSINVMDHQAAMTVPSSTEMSSAEVLRNSITPLGMNNSLNIQRNENTSTNLVAGMSSFIQNNNERVPLDRPLYINTAMTAQQRIDIYRHLSGPPPQDDEPALLFRWS